MTATSTIHSSESSPRLYLAFELGWSMWKLAFSIGGCSRPRIRQIRARDLETLRTEISKAKKRFALPEDTPVFSCYEAGRDGFWLHRYLETQGIHNRVLDASSIGRSGRRHVKTDRIDAEKLVALLERLLRGEKRACSVVQVPAPDIEDVRHLHREIETLQGERTEHVNRIKGMLALVGVELKEVNAGFVEWLTEVRLWNGASLGADLHQRLQREYARWQTVDRQVAEVEEERLRRLQDLDSEEPSVKIARLLWRLKGIGPTSAWLFAVEFFAWRTFRNGKQVGALAGLTPTPYDSGDSSREQGISKAGNRRVRALAIEIAWLWLRYQPRSKLSRWFQRRFGGGKSRLRRIGIVALARRLLIALWRYLQTGEAPEGAVFKEDAQRKRAKLKARRARLKKAAAPADK